MCAPYNVFPLPNIILKHRRKRSCFPHLPGKGLSILTKVQLLDTSSSSSSSSPSSLRLAPAPPDVSLVIPSSECCGPCRNPNHSASSAVEHAFMRERMPEQMPDTMSEHMPERMSDGMSEYLCIYIYINYTNAMYIYICIYIRPNGMPEAMSEWCVRVGVTRRKQLKECLGNHSPTLICFELTRFCTSQW